MTVMPITFTPTPEQKDALLKVEEAYLRFEEQNPFSAPLDLTELNTAAEAYSDLFPVEFQSAVVKSFFSEGNEPDFQELEDLYEGYADAVAEVILSVMALDHAQAIGTLQLLMDVFHEGIYRTKQYLYEYWDSDKEIWI